MTYRIAICDDSVTDAGYVCEILNCWSDERSITVRVEQFNSAENFLFHYAEDKDWDILLLDIEMGAMDGVTYSPVVKFSG